MKKKKENIVFIWLIISNLFLFTDSGKEKRNNANKKRYKTSEEYAEGL